jgi:predicted DNA-binding protein (MmcQ/YjbR family)
MDIEAFREYCLSKPYVTEGFPFGETTLVFKAAGKMFALANLDGDKTVNLKCNPDLAIELREKFPSIIPGYHMNKAHWNTIYFDGSIPEKLFKEMIDHSYWAVVSRLNKALRLKIENMQYYGNENPN